MACYSVLTGQKAMKATETRKASRTAATMAPPPYFARKQSAPGTLQRLSSRLDSLGDSLLSSAAIKVGPPPQCRVLALRWPWGQLATLLAANIPSKYV